MLAPRWWTTLLTIATLLVASLLVTSSSPAAAADATVESQFVGWINRERRAAGLHELVVRSDLRDVARRHSQRMASDGTLRHNPNRTSEVCCWQKLAENVAYGSDPARVHQRLMASSGHRANILDPDMTELGVGVELRDGVYWVTQLFRLPNGAAPPPPPESRPPTPAREEPKQAEPSPSEQHPSQAGPAPLPSPEPPPPPLYAGDRFAVMMGRIEPLESRRTFSEVMDELER